MSARVCHGCGAPLPPNKNPGRPRKWCSGRCRKQTLYSGECVDCGGPTGGSSGRGQRSERCRHCRAVYQHEIRYWTPERIIEAILGFAERYGRAPGAADFSPASARQLGHPERSERFRADGCYPTSWTVQHEFGSWNAAIVAAGLEPRKVGHYGRPGEAMELCREVAEKYAAGSSTVRLAREYGCTPPAIERRIRKAGGVLRSRPEAQALRRKPVAA